MGLIDIAGCSGTCSSPWSFPGEKDTLEVLLLCCINEKYS